MIDRVIGTVAARESAKRDDRQPIRGVVVVTSLCCGSWNYRKKSGDGRVIIDWSLFDLSPETEG